MKTIINLTAEQSFSAKSVSTSDLLKGLLYGFSVTYYEPEACRELLDERCKESAIRVVYRRTTLKMTKTAIRRAFAERNIPLAE